MVVIEQESFKLTAPEQMGKDYEEQVKSILIANGFGRYITYSNPTNDQEWKASTGNGVDSILEIGRYRIDLEIKYNQADYSVRLAWLGRDGIGRFRKSPPLSSYNLRIIVVSRPKNWVTARSLASYFGVMVLSIQELLILLSNLVTSNNYVSSVNNYQYIDYLCNYRINNNLLNNSRIENNINNKITCYQNSFNITISTEDIALERVFEHDFFQFNEVLPFSLLGNG